ncbi:unnamed protein product, partial [Natator depressus]
CRRQSLAASLGPPLSTCAIPSVWSISQNLSLWSVGTIFAEPSVQRNCNRETRQLANVVEIAKQLSFQAAKGTGGDGVCETHQEALKLICEEDQTPICVICRESWAHCAHTVVPIQEAAQEYK